MNDYAGKLVSRSTAPMTVVRPRLLSLFEPPRADHRLAPEDEFEPTSLESDPVVRPRFDRAQAELIQSFEPHAIDDNLTVQTPSPKVHSETVKQAEPDDVNVKALDSTQLAPQNLSGKPGQTRTEPLPSPLETGGPILPSPSHATVSPLEKTAQERRSEQNHPGFLQLDDRAEDHQQRAFSPIPKSAVRVLAETQTPPVTLPDQDHKDSGFAPDQKTVIKVLARSAFVRQAGVDPQQKSLATMPITPAPNNNGPPALHSPLQAERQVEKPSIHVTIGRVEVRATLPPAAPQRQVRQPRVMSLDEYLHQRASGG